MAPAETGTAKETSNGHCAAKTSDDESDDKQNKRSAGDEGEVMVLDLTSDEAKQLMKVASSSESPAPITRLASSSSGSPISASEESLASCGVDEDILSERDFDKIFSFLREKEGWIAVEDAKMGLVYIRPSNIVKQIGFKGKLHKLHANLDYFTSKQKVVDWVSSRENMLIGFATYESLCSLSNSQTLSTSTAPALLYSPDLVEDIISNTSTQTNASPSTQTSQSPDLLENSQKRKAESAKNDTAIRKGKRKSIDLAESSGNDPGSDIDTLFVEKESDSSLTTLASLAMNIEHDKESVSRESHHSSTSSSSDTLRGLSDLEHRHFESEKDYQASSRSRSRKKASARFTVMQDKFAKEISWENETVLDMRDQNQKRLSYEGWNIWLDKTLDALGGWKAVECSSVRLGSNDFNRESVCSNRASTKQFRAQYGRANPHLVQTCIREAKITENDKFIDIGSGIGQVVFQVASCVGCPSIGIELLKERHGTAVALKRLHDKFCEDHGILSGATKFFFDDFTRPDRRDLLKSATVFFVNNAQGTFGVRCVEAGTMTLDMHVAAIARRAMIGSRFICFDPIYELECEELFAAFRVRRFRTLQSATDWSADPLEITIYEKMLNTWTCPRCTFVNELTDPLGEPFYSCGACSQDPHGMQRESYSTRSKRTSVRLGLQCSNKPIKKVVDNNRRTPNVKASSASDDPIVLN